MFDLSKLEGNLYRRQDLMDVLDSEEFILSDNNLFCPNNNWYREIYGARTVDQIPRQTLIHALMWCANLNSWFNLHGQVYTVTNIVKEMKRFHGILRGKIDYLNCVQKRRRFIKGKEKIKKRNKGEIKKHRKYHQEQRQFYFTICNFYNKVITNVKTIKPESKIILPFNRFLNLEERMNFYENEFVSLQDIILYLGNDQITDAKRDYTWRYNCIKSKAKDLHADEQLVAMALYQSIIKNQSCAILTRDSDIQRLLCAAKDYLTHSSIGGNEHIIKALKNNPIKVYYDHPREEQIKMNIDTSKDEVKNCSLYNIVLLEGESLAQKEQLIVNKVKKILTKGDLITQQDEQQDYIPTLNFFFEYAN